MGTCRSSKSRFFFTFTLLISALLIIAASGLWAQVSVSITVPHTKVVGQPGVDTPVDFVLHITTTGTGTVSIGNPKSIVLSCSPDADIYTTPFPLDDTCPSGNENLAYSEVNGDGDIVFHVFPAKDCKLQLNIAAGAFTTTDDPPLTNDKAASSPVVTYVDAPRTLIKPISTDPTNDPTVFFHVQFSKPVHGLTNTDVTFEPVGNPGAAGGTKMAVFTEDAGYSGDVFTAGVSGMTYPGRVQMILPQESAVSDDENVGNWTANASSCTVDSVVFDNVAPVSLAVTRPSAGDGKVDVSTYAATYTTPRPILDIAGTADDDSNGVGINSVTWSNDRGGSGTCSGTTSWVHNGIYLEPGTNVITITAYDTPGNSTRYTLTVNCTNKYWNGVIDNGNSYNPVAAQGVSSSLKLDPVSGYPKVSYCDSTNGDLKYAEWDGSNWQVQTLDGSASNVGAYTSLALDADGNPRIAYYDVTNTDLKYAYLKDGAWKYSIVDGTSGADDNVGMYCSLALDVSGRPRIAYYDVTNGDLLYAQGSDADNPAWTIIPVYTAGFVGKYCSLALYADKPRISFYDVTQSALMYAEGSLAINPSFTCSTVESANDVGQYSSLALDTSGRPRIAYYDNTNKDLRYAEGSAAVSPAWTTGAVDSTADSVGMYCSLALDSKDKPSIAYYDTTGGNLKLAEGNNSVSPAWAVSILDDGQAEASVNSNDVGKYASLKFDKHDNPHLTYQDVTNNSLKYRYRIGNSTSGYQPSCTVTAPASPAISTPLIFTVAFSEAVDDFAASDISISNGFVSSLVETTPNMVYRVEVFPYVSGAVSCYVPGDAATSMSSDLGNLPSDTESVLFFEDAPRVDVSHGIGQLDPTSQLPVHFTIVFSEPVNGLTGDDIVIGGTAGVTKSTLAGGGSYYDLAINAVSGKGSITVTVPANVATSASGIANSASSTDSIWYDAVAPTCTISRASTQNYTTSSAIINFTASFSEPVVGFAGSYTAVDIASALTISGNATFSSPQAVITPIGTADSYHHYSKYNVAVRGMNGSGIVRVSIPAGAARDCDPSGNGINSNTASTSMDAENTVQYNYTGETELTVLVNQSNDQIDPTEDDTIHFTAEFSAAVTGFSDTGVVLDGTASATTAKVTPTTDDGTTYDIAVSGMTKSGTVKVTIPAGVAQDIKNGNGNMASDSSDNTVQYYQPLTVIVTPSQTDPFTTLPVTFSAVFSKAVSPTDFASADVEVSGTAFEDGTTPTVTVANADATYKVYTISVSNIHKSGSVTVRIPADVVTVDGFGNSASDPESPATAQYNAPAPTVNVSRAAGQAKITNSPIIHFTAVFSEAVTDFTSGGVTLSGAGADTVVVNGIGTTYDIAVSGMKQFGVVEVNVNAGAAHNSVNIGNEASTGTDNEVTYDNVNPSVVVARASTQLTKVYDAAAINFTVTFSEAVTGFDDSSDVVISGTAGATNATISGSGAVYNVAVSGMTTDGTVTMSVPANKVTDYAGNGNTASTTDSLYAPLITYYNTPIVTINQAASQVVDPAQSCPIYFTAVFSEPVTDFDDIADIYFTKSDPKTLTGTPLPTISEVAPSNDIGKYSCLTLDSSGNPHLSYFDSTAGVLKYAAGDFANPRWTTSTADAQAFGVKDTSLAINGAGNPRISYYDFLNGDLKYAAWDGSRWRSQTVDETGDVGMYTSLKLNAAGVPFISYYDNENSKLKYAYYNNGSWNCTTVVGVNSSASDKVGKYSSLAFDTSGRPRIAYYDEKNGDILYAEGSAAQNPTWTIQAVDSTDDVGQYVSLALDSAGKPRISYYDVTNGNLKYAEGDAPTGPKFTVVAVDNSANNVGLFSSLKLDSGGLPRIAYYDATGKILKYAQGDAAALPINWSIKTADDGTPADADHRNVGQYCSLVLDSSDVPCISYYDAINGNLKYAIGDGAVATSFTDTAMTDGTTYEIAVNDVIGVGTITAVVPADVATDAAGIKNSASTSTDNQISLDNQPPTVTISLADGQVSPTNGSPVNFIVEFSETIQGLDAEGKHRDFGAGDVTVTGSGTAGVTIEKTVVPIVPGKKYNVAVSSMTDGTVTLQVEAGKVFDTAGNANAASTTKEAGVTDTVLFDRTSPVATIKLADGQVDPTTDPQVNFLVTLSEAVKIFTKDNIDISQSTVGGNLSIEVNPIDSLTYTVTVDGASHSGSVIVNIPVGSIQDAAGNYNVNLEDGSNIVDNEVVYDDQSNPTVTITRATGQALIAKNQPIKFKVVFSEPVTGFGDSSSDVDTSSSTAGGAKTVAVSGSGTTYEVTVSDITSSGTVQIDIPAAAAVDLSGVNYNEASDGGDNVVTYDITAPTVQMEPAGDNPTNESPVHFTVTFSKPVTGFTSSDVSADGTAGATTAVVTPDGGSVGQIFDVAVSGMTSSGFVSISIPAGAANDVAGNPNTAGVLLDQISYTWPGPSVTITKDNDLTNKSPVNFKVVFSSAVTGFEDSDVDLSGLANPTTADVSGTGAVYTVAVSGMGSSGDVTISIPRNAVIDLEGNGNTASDECTVDYDMDVPTVTLSRAAGQEDTTRTLPICFTAVFSEPVSGFDKSDMKIKSTASGTTSVTLLEAEPFDRTTYNITVSGLTSAGTLTAQIPASVASDDAGNLNTVSSAVMVTYTWKPLTATIGLDKDQADTTNTSPINLKVVFSEDVNDFATGDVTLAGTAGATSAVVAKGADNKTYSVAVSGMSKTGTVIASIDEAVVHNGYGDANSASDPITVNYDNVAPKITITSPTTDSECTKNCNTVTISGTASDDKGIVSVKWSKSSGSSGECSGVSPWSTWSTGDITIPDDGDDSYSDTITVTAIDTAGNKGTDTLKVNVLERTPGDAWTSVAMVSLPIIPDETDPKAAIDFYTNCWAMYDTQSNAYVMYPDDLTWFDPADQTPGRGFWVRFGSTHLTPTGIIPSQKNPATIHLYAGWNMIGNPFVKDVTWDSDAIKVNYMGSSVTLREADSLVCNYAWGWDPDAGSYYLVYDKSVLPDAVGVLAPWQAFWIKAKAECDLILPAP
ncbi:MAG: hypothetical protein ABFD83_01885 [Armatimonadota bacterium]